MQSKSRETVSQLDSHRYHDLKEGQMLIYRHLAAASAMFHLAETDLRQPCRRARGLWRWCQAPLHRLKTDRGDLRKARAPAVVA